MNTRRCFSLYLRWLGWWAALWLMAGCASSQPMALASDDERLEVGQDSILLLRIHTINRFKPDYQPAVLAIHVIDQATGEPLDFKPRARLLSLSEGYEYLVSLRLPPGQYEIVSLTGMGFGYHIQAHFEVPVHRRVTAQVGKVLYLGRIEARNVARTSPEQPPAGPELPLIDQTVCGFKGGTFDVEFGNFFQEDVQAFRRTFPALKGIGVEVLAPRS